MSLSMKVARIQSQGSGRAMPGIGDPGLFGFLGGVAKTFAQAIPGPIGGIARQFFSPPVVTNGQVSAGGLPPAPSGFFQQQQGPPPSPLKRLGQQLIPGGKTGFEVSGFNGNGTILACATGHHPNKSDYFLKNGTFIQKGSRCVKNRRRNPLNARAADRAISRIESAKRATKRLGRITIRKTCPK